MLTGFFQIKAVSNLFHLICTFHGCINVSIVTCYTSDLNKVLSIGFIANLTQPNRYDLFIVVYGHPEVSFAQFLLSFKEKLKLLAPRNWIIF